MTRRALGAWLLGAVVVFAALGPVLITADPARQDLAHFLEPPGAAYWLGADHLGRSMLARLAHAGRLSLGLAGLAVLAAAVPGIALGVLAAWRGGFTDRALVALADGVLALPGLLLVLLLASLSPGEIWPLVLGFALALWVEYFRVVRATARPLLASPQVEASRLLGFGPAYIARVHVWPELAPVLGTMMAFGAGAAILGIASLGFIGVGLVPPRAEWGLMLTELLPHHAEAPWLLLWPVLMIFVTVLGLQLLAGRRAA